MIKQNVDKRYVLVLFVMLITFQGLNAAPVYKSKDSDGNVTYSSEPPEEATQVKEVAVPKSSSGTGASDNTVDEIKKKADALASENRAREKEIKKNKQSISSETKPVKEEAPVQKQRPIIQNRPNVNPPAGGSPPVAMPLPSRAN